VLRFCFDWRRLPPAGFDPRKRKTPQVETSGNKTLSLNRKIEYEVRANSSLDG
jgi:hypothetical protein